MIGVARWGTVIGVGGASAALALWLRSLGIFSAGAAMIALRASAVPFGSPPSLEALGFDLPPLPIALAMPLAALPALRWDPFAPVVVSALAAGLAAWWLFGSLRAMGLGAASAAAIVVGVAAHPVWLYSAASGSGSVLAGALLVAALRLYRRWQRAGEALALLASSFAMAASGLARYDLFVVGWAISLLIWRGPIPTSLGQSPRSARVLDLVAAAPRSARPGDDQVAFSVAYAAAVTGALGLWVVATGLLTGDAFAFVGRSLDAVAAPPSAQPPLHALLVIAPALAASGVALALRRGRGTAVAAVVIAASATVSSVVTGSPLSLDAVVPLVPLTGLLVGESVAARHGLRRVALAAATPLLVAAGALAVAASADWGEGHRAAAEALAGRPRPMWGGERDLASFMRQAGGRVLVDERIDGVAALLLHSDPRSGGPLQMLDPVAAVAPRPGASAPGSARLGDGPPHADFVLVRTPTGRGTAHRVAAAWPTLYGGGAPWATLAGTWPVSGEPAEYRLYAVVPR